MGKRTTFSFHYLFNYKMTAKDKRLHCEQIII